MTCGQPAKVQISKITITSFTVRDVRWPTSLERIGADSMNTHGDDAHGRVYFQ